MSDGRRAGAAVAPRRGAAWSGGLVGAPPAVGRPRAAWRRLSRNKLALAGSLVALAYVVVGVVGPYVVAHDYAKQDLLAANQAPFAEGHWLGTDHVGRDLLSRLVTGVRISLLVGFGVTFISLVVGTLAGSLAGYYRG